MKHTCHFCGRLVDKTDFKLIEPPAFGVYVCNKNRCQKQLIDFIENQKEGV